MNENNTGFLREAGQRGWDQSIKFILGPGNFCQHILCTGVVVLGRRSSGQTSPSGVFSWHAETAPFVFVSFGPLSESKFVPLLLKSHKGGCHPSTTGLSHGLLQYRHCYCCPRTLKITCRPDPSNPFSPSTTVFLLASDNASIVRKMYIDTCSVQKTK